MIRSTVGEPRTKERGKPRSKARPVVRAAMLGCAALGAVALGLPSGCNVFIGFGRCETDSDCPRELTCDRGARACFDPSGPTPPRRDAEAPTDGGPSPADADGGAPSACDPTAPFGPVRPVPGFADTALSSARFSSDESRVLYAALAGCSLESCIDLFVATRARAKEPYVTSGPLSGVNLPDGSEYWPTVTSDGLVLFFESGRDFVLPDGGRAGPRPRIWSATRVNQVADFRNPTVQAPFLVDGNEGAPYLHPSGSAVYFSSSARRDAGGFDLYVAELDGFGLARSIASLSAVNSDAFEGMPVVTRDHLTLFFAREIGGTNRAIFQSTRRQPDEPFGSATPLSELASSADTFPSWISDDGCRLYVIRSPGGAAAIDSARLGVATRGGR